MDKIKELENWLAQDYGLVILKDNEVVFKSKEHGIKSLYNLVKASPDKLKDALVFDKRVGRAAALLFIFTGIDELITGYLSKLGKETLEQNNIKFQAKEIVEKMLNREGNDMCPFEKLSLKETPKDYFEVLSEKCFKD